jgi:hypothetical protein
MTNLRQAAQQALEALESGLAFDAHSAVLQNLRTALAQPEQEPVISAWSLREVYFDEDGEPSMHRSPPAAQRPWQGLEAEEILDLFDMTNVYGSKWIEFARAIEAALRSKNK